MSEIPAAPAAPHVPDADRYDGRMPYRRCGRSGVRLPAISLGLWHNFGDDRALGEQRALLRRAFDLGVTHFEICGALDAAVRQGKALYVGISSYSAARTREAAAILRELGTPLLIHQPAYSMLNRWIEDELLDALADVGAGCIAFSPLAQGVLTDKYLGGIPAGSRVTRSPYLSEDHLRAETLDHVRALDAIARGRGQSLAQMAVAWTLRDPRVTSALVGASSVRQLEDTLGALRGLDFSDDELAAIDRHAVESGLDLWAPSSTA